MCRIVSFPMVTDAIIFVIFLLQRRAQERRQIGCHVVPHSCAHGIELFNQTPRSVQIYPSHPFIVIFYVVTCLILSPIAPLFVLLLVVLQGCTCSDHYYTIVGHISQYAARFSVQGEQRGRKKKRKKNTHKKNKNEKK